jgi:hypothetical protein
LRIKIDIKGLQYAAVFYIYRQIYPPLHHMKKKPVPFIAVIMHFGRICPAGRQDNRGQIKPGGNPSLF